MAEDIFGSISNITGSSSFSGVLNIFYGIFLVAVVGIVLYWFMRPKMYPICLLIRKKVGSGYQHVADDAKIVIQDGMQQMYAFKINKYYPVPNSDRLLPMRGFFKKWCVHMYQDINGDLSTIEFGSEEYDKKCVPRDQELHLWAQTQRKRLAEKYSADWMGKYGVLIGEGIVAMSLIIVTLVIMNKHVEASQLLSNAMKETTTVLQAIRGGV